MLNLRDKIWEWAESLEDWQNDLLRRIYEKGELTETDRQEVKENLFATTLGIDLPNEIIRLQKDQVQTGISDEEPVRIKKLSNLRSEEHTSELQSRGHLVCRLLLDKKNNMRKKICFCT